MPEEWASRSVRTSFPCASNGSRSPCETDDEVSRLKTTRAVRNDDEAPPRGNFAFERETRRVSTPYESFSRHSHFSLRLINRARDFHPISAFDSRPRLLPDSLARTLYRAPKYVRRDNYGSAARRLIREVSRKWTPAEVTAAAATAASAPATATAAAMWRRGVKTP